MLVIDYDITCYITQENTVTARFRCEMATSIPLPCSYIVSTEVALLFGSVSSFGVLDKGVPSGIWHDRSMGKKIVL